MFKILSMKKTYNLLSNIEPSEIELRTIMIAVLEDVNIRAQIGKEKFDLLQKNQIKDVFEKYKNNNFQNAKK